MYVNVSVSRGQIFKRYQQLTMLHATRVLACRYALQAPRLSGFSSCPILASRPSADSQQQLYNKRWPTYATKAQQSNITGNTQSIPQLATSVSKPVMDSPTTSAADLAERLVGAPLQPSSGPLFLSSPQRQSHAFLLLSAASLLIGVAALSSPELMLSVLSGDSPTALELALSKVAAATMLMNAAVSYSLQGDAAAGHLKSSTCQRLLLANMAKDVMFVMAMGLSPELWSPALASWYLAPAGASLIITGASLRSALQQSGAVSTIAGIKNAVVGWRRPKTAAGWGYSVLTVVYVAAAAACYAPEVLFTGAAATPVSQLMKHTWVPGILLAGAGCWAMADAADKGKDAVAASTFRTLNLGVIATELAFLPVLGLCMKTGLVVNNFLSWGFLASPVVISLYCLYRHQACYSAGDDNAN